MPLDLTAKYDDYSIITSTTKKGTVIEIMVDNEDVDKVLNRGYKYLQLANTNQSKPTLYGVFPNRKLENLKSIIIGKSDNIAHRDGNKFNYRKNNLVEYNIDRNKDQYNHEIKIKGDYALIKVSNPNSQNYKNFEFVVDTDQLETLKPFKRFGIKNEKTVIGYYNPNKNSGSNVEIKSVLYNSNNNRNKTGRIICSDGNEMNLRLKNLQWQPNKKPQYKLPTEIGNYIVLTSRMKNGELKPYLLGAYKTEKEAEEEISKLDLPILKIIEAYSPEHEQVLEYLSSVEKQRKARWKSNELV
ncbi:hypothetical protein [Terrihalobacillus insolitus]|uniref:hypothetical protein n=1 Tax=Terrihalobacillus insolitus TaxID=2950438 RepID=UPI00233F8C4C|nr:hypothetical protein [Terrihalobacillus insolitus]MDC3413904.1 hypothetical protein [Terrihalobacillus insolitus]